MGQLMPKIPHSVTVWASTSFHAFFSPCFHVHLVSVFGLCLPKIQEKRAMVVRDVKIKQSKSKAKNVKNKNKKFYKTNSLWATVQGTRFIYILSNWELPNIVKLFFCFFCFFWQCMLFLLTYRQKWSRLHLHLTDGLSVWWSPLKQPHPFVSTLHVVYMIFGYWP